MNFGPHRREHRAHVEAARQLVVELLGLDDGGVVIRQKAGDRGHDALAVRAHQQQRKGGFSTTYATLRCLQRSVAIPAGNYLTLYPRASRQAPSARR